MYISFWFTISQNIVHVNIERNILPGFSICPIYRVNWLVNEPPNANSIVCRLNFPRHFTLWRLHSRRHAKWCCWLIFAWWNFPWNEIHFFDIWRLADILFHRLWKRSACHRALYMSHNIACKICHNRHLSQDNITFQSTPVLKWVPSRFKFAIHIVAQFGSGARVGLSKI